MCTISVTPEPRLHRDMDTKAADDNAVSKVGFTAKWMSNTSPGIIKTKKRIGNVAKGRNCLIAFLYCSLFDLKHTYISFITMAPMATDDAKRMIKAGQSQSTNLSMSAALLPGSASKM